jgi:HAD superfamily hydrolase (TIGR01548 family)
MVLMMDLLIFDMDGVLVDVSRSYRKTIQKTIDIYLRECLGMKADMVSLEEISLFKSAGGFNNDWDLTAGFLLYLLSVAKVPPLPGQKKFLSPDMNVLYLREHLSSFRQRNPLKIRRSHFASFIGQIKASGGGLKGVSTVLGDSWDPWIYRSGDLGNENLVKRIFQEIYLGEEFSPFYRLQNVFWRDKGLYHREKLLIGKDILSSLRKKSRLGIASGRPRFEAELALKRFGIFRCFDSVVTLDECEQEEANLLRSTGKKIKLSKPHPFSILKVVEETGLSNPKCAYIGDTVDDIRTAKAARKQLDILAVGFVSSHAKRKEGKASLLHAGADLILENPKELLHITS